MNPTTWPEPLRRHPARELRCRRLHRHGERLVVVPLDHSVADGPLAGGRPLGPLVAGLAGSGVDAVVLHKGALPRIDPRHLVDLSVVVHLNASTRHAPDPDAKHMVTTVEEAVRLGADAVSIHVNLGSDDEATQVVDLARAGEACDRHNVPLLAMVYPRGPRTPDPSDPDLVAHAAVLAADLGADWAKVPWAGSVEAMLRVVAASPLPLLVAGGPRRPGVAALRRHVEDVMSSGVAGLAMGRNVFEADDPQQAASVVCRTVHRGSDDVDPIAPRRDHEFREAVLA